MSENKKFKSTEMTFDELGAALEEIIEELSQLLEPEADCESCGNECAQCPDCEQCDADEEADADV